MSRLRRLRHLVERFLGYLRARRPGPAEQTKIAARLSAEEQIIFFAQAPADQRHALQCLQRVEASSPDRDDLAAAALLHDVGKRHSGLGVVGRVLASALDLVGLPAPGRLGHYLDHGNLGAEDLERAGSDPLAVAFARHHQARTPPAGFPEHDWAVLIASDEGRKPPSGEQRPIT
jgi:hypothetical protein